MLQFVLEIFRKLFGRVSQLPVEQKDAEKAVSTVHRTAKKSADDRLIFISIPFIFEASIAVLPSRYSNEVKYACSFLESRKNAENFLDYLIEHASTNNYQIFVHQRRVKFNLNVHSLEQFHGIFHTRKVDFSQCKLSELLKEKYEKEFKKESPKEKT